MMRRPAASEPKKPSDSVSLLTVNPMAISNILKGPLEKETEKAETGQALEFYSPTPQLLGFRCMDRCRPFRCFLCWEAGHMAHQCRNLSEAPRQAVRQAGEAFLSATQGRSQTTDTKPRADREFHRQIRVAKVQALCEGVKESHDERTRPTTRQLDLRSWGMGGKRYGRRAPSVPSPSPG